MGVCNSCCNKDDTHSQYGESEERANLIESNNECVITQRSQSETIYTCHSKTNKKVEEQSDVNKIIQEMATNVIDVGSLGSRVLEQHEYRERISHYLTKLRSINASKLQFTVQKYCLLIDIPVPEKVLFSESIISKEEFNQICGVLTKIDKAVKNPKMKRKDDILVPFKVS